MRRSLVLVTLGVLALVMATLPAGATPKPPDKHPVAIGTDGAVSSVDPLATEAGLAILERGGNAIDAAVATAAVLGVTRPALSRVLNEKAALSPEMALRIEKAFGPKADHLMRIQLAYDMARARENAGQLRVSTEYAQRKPS